MIISHKYKYIFIEVPRTGSTAIAKELCENYAGEGSKLRKHANYFEFLREAREEEKNYFVFQGVRNPLDEAVSLYEKIRTDHKGRHTREEDRLRNGGFIGQHRLKMFEFVQEHPDDYKAFLERFWHQPYTSNANINRRFCHDLIHFESMQEDFARILSRLGIEKVRDIPQVNPTSAKKPFYEYYSLDMKPHVVRIFGPFMKEWGYEFSPEWGACRPGAVATAKYELRKLARHTYIRLLMGNGPLRRFYALRERFE